MQSDFIADIEKIIGYSFREKQYLIQAFTHSSYSNENKNFPDYERLEFLGDAALNFIITEYLYKYYPNMSEGELTKKRAGLVSETTLAEIIDKLSLNDYILAGAGNTKDQINHSNSVKCDLFESITGAILLDSNMDMEIVKKFVLNNLENKIADDVIDFKSKFLERCAQNKMNSEFITKSLNPEGFETILYINGKESARGQGKNKKSAEKQASKNYMLSLNNRL